MAGKNSPQPAPQYVQDVQITDLKVQERLKKYNSLRVLVLGKSGVGKSSLVNALFGSSKVAKVGTINAETPGVKCYDLELGDVIIKIFDTPGFMSGESKSNKKYLQNIRDVCKCADVVFLCFRMEGHSKDLEEPLNLLARSFDKKSKFWSKTMIVFTMANRVIPTGPHRHRPRDEYNGFIFSEFKEAVKALLKKKSIEIDDNQFVRAGHPDVLNEGERLANHSKFDDSKEWTPDFLIQCFKSECWSEDAKATLLRANWGKIHTISTALSAAGAPVLEGAGIACVVIGAGSSVAGPMAWPVSLTLFIAGGVLCAAGIAAATLTPAAVAGDVYSKKKKAIEYVKKVHDGSKHSTATAIEPQPNSGGTNAIPMDPMQQ